MNGAVGLPLIPHSGGPLNGSSLKARPHTRYKAAIGLDGPISDPYVKQIDSQSELWVWLCHGTHQLLTYISLGQGRHTIHTQIHEKNLLIDMKIKLYNEFFVSVLYPTVSLQERTAQSLMRRRLAARPAERAAPIRHLPTQL